MIGDKGSFLACAFLLSGTAVALIVLALLGKVHGVAWSLLLAAGIVGGGAALLGWRRAVRVAVQVVAAEDREVDQLEAEQARLDADVAEHERTIEELRGAVFRERRAREELRAWNAELREKVLELQHAQGVLGSDDVRELVLRTAMSLLEADKGLLLSREDEDADGDFDLVCALGFEQSPEHSAVTQRFAREVLDRDAIVREEHANEDEIRNLVAIPMYLLDRFSGVVVCCNLRSGVHEHDEEVLLALGAHAGIVLHNARLHGRLRSSYLSTVAMLADAIGAKDPLVGGHSEAVARYVAAVASRLGIEGRRREELVFASLLHDVGKIGVSERILCKPARLTPEERSAVELHPRIGCRLVEQVPELRAMAAAILHHHEWFDGTGYPSRLKGEEIPLEARVIAVADSFCAMTTDRPYKARVSVEEACAELERCAATQFDPAVVKLFVAEVRRNPEAVEAPPADLAAADADLALRRDDEGRPFGANVIDGVTLLYTRRHLHEVAHAEALRGEIQEKPFTVILVELAELDRINRERGYADGDAELQRVARVLEQAAGRVAGTAARFSGRRLALLVPGADEDIAEKLTEELGTDLADRAGGLRIVHASWRDGENGEAVIARARTKLDRERAAV